MPQPRKCRAPSTRVTTTPTPDGLLLVDKPAGVSSHDVVAAARRAVGEKRIGHAGTLDPFATGLLVLLVGRATRLLPHIPDEPKLYEARVKFGAETDTEDLLGTVTREAARPLREELLENLRHLQGPLLQRPPAYSAKRVGGKRAYELAREGKPVALAPVTIHVHRISVLDIAVDPAGRVAEATIRVSCGGGTYIRSLARDWAEMSKSAAHLVALRRLATGPFRVEDALSLDDLREKRAQVRPALDALPGLPVQPVSDEELAKIVRGIDVPATVPGGWGALVRADTSVLVALAQKRGTAADEGGERWQPRVVMREA